MTMQDSSSMVEEGPATAAEGAAGGKKRVVVIGAGWAGLAAAYELSKQVSTWRSAVDVGYDAMCPTTTVDITKCTWLQQGLRDRESFGAASSSRSVWYFWPVLQWHAVG